MIIHGLQKMTLLDFPGHVACTVFLGGCDLRCPFCHNAELIQPSEDSALMDEKKLYELLMKRKGLLDGVAFTGGEPLLRKDLPDVLKEIRNMGYKIKIDTNGNHPDRLEHILNEGLADYIAMDVKNGWSRYAETAGIPGFSTDNIDKSIAILLNGDTDYEFRTTVLKPFHDADSFKEIAEMIKGAENYFLQGFVDRESVPFAGLSAYSKEEMEEFEKIVRPYVKKTGIRGV